MEVVKDLEDFLGRLKIEFARLPEPPSLSSPQFHNRDHNRDAERGGCESTAAETMGNAPEASAPTAPTATAAATMAGRGGRRGRVIHLPGVAPLRRDLGGLGSLLPSSSSTTTKTMPFTSTTTLLTTTTVAASSSKSHEAEATAHARGHNDGGGDGAGYDENFADDYDSDGGREWRVDVPLRFRGRAAWGSADVTLEMLRVEHGRELPDGTPRRDSTWGGRAKRRKSSGNSGNGPGSGGTKEKGQGRRRRKKGEPRWRGAVDALIDTGETAVVLALFGAANPGGACAKISSALAWTGAVCVAADLTVAALGRFGGDEWGEWGGDGGGGGGEGGSEGVGGKGGERFFPSGATTAGALAGRFCGGRIGTFHHVIIVRQKTSN
jgi:hypothetical protein